jgi:hypothetical protein
MGKYATETTVSSEKTRLEIERVLTRYGATAFAYGWEGSRALIGFTLQARQYRFILPLPERDAREFTHTGSRGLRRPVAGATAAWEQACRSRWRALLLVIKAKLEAVEVGVSTLESELLSALVLPDGRTFSEWAGPQAEYVYRTGRMPDLLPGLPEGERILALTDGSR